jgi:penicillin-binding protein-related factor A (putative recombinase)
MPEPFYKRLEKYFSDVGRVLQGEADAASIFPNGPNIGLVREQVYAEVLRQHLPFSCSVVQGGYLFDLEGRESRQLDLMIIKNNSIQFNHFNNNNSGLSFACIDGCMGVVSVKSNLNCDTLCEALENIASIPDKQVREDKINPSIRLSEEGYNDWPFKVIYANNGMSLESCYIAINNFYKENSEIPMHKRPNLIHVAGKHYLFRAPYDNKLGERIVLKGEYMGSVRNPDYIGLLHAIINIHSIASISDHMLYNYNTLFYTALNTNRL